MNHFTLKTRLVVASLLAAILALVVANSLAYVSLQRTLISRVDSSLRTVSLPTKGKGQRTLFPAAFFYEFRAVNGLAIQSVDATNRRGKAVRPVIPSNLDLGGTSASPKGKAKFFTTTASAAGTRFRVKAAKTKEGEILILASTLDAVDDTLDATLVHQLLITVAVTAMVAVLSWLLVRQSLRPLSELEQTAATIAAGDRSARVKSSGSRDVRELGDTFNTMVDKLAKAIDSETKAAATTRRFVDDAAHELRTPTTAIVAYSQLLQSKERSEEEFSRICNGIRGESDRLRQLVDELLTLARADQEQIPTQTYELVDLSAIALRAVNSSLLVGPAYPIDFDAPEHVWYPGSNTEFQRVFDNLLTNIRTHTEAGTSGRVEIRQTTNQVILCVEDNGGGVDDDQHQHLFERFWRGDTSRTRTTGGSGLGLSIVRALIEQHEGTVYAEPNPGGGTRIEIRLPAKTTFP